MPVMSKEQFVQAIIHDKAVKKKAYIDFMEFKSGVYMHIDRRLSHTKRGLGAWQTKGRLK